MSFTFYPPHLTSPKNNNPHYREGSSCLQYLSPKPQRPSQNWLCTRCPTGTPGSSDDTGWLNSGSIATALKGRGQICGCKTLSDAPDGRPADAAAGSSATLEGLSGDAEGFCPP